MAEKSHVYEIVNHANNGKVLATLWWDGKSIQTDNQAFLKRIKRLQIHGKSLSDGPEFLERLKYHYKNGYVMARKVKS